MIANPILFGEGDRPTNPITPVGWVQSDGTSCIDLGVQPDEYAWRLWFSTPKFSDLTDRSKNPLIHAAESDDSTATQQLIFQLKWGTNQFARYFRQGASTLEGSNNVGSSSITDVKRYFETRGSFTSGSTTYVSYNNPWSSPATISVVNKSNTSAAVSANMYLFGLPSQTDKCDFKVYGITFFERNPYPESSNYYNLKSVARHFVPSLRNGVAGLYDMVTKTFCGNAAQSGTILYGG